MEIEKEKILVIGCNGLVGSKFFRKKDDKYDFFGTYNSEVPELGGNKDNLFQLNITNKENVDEILKKVNPDYIIHTASITNVDYCEDHKEESYDVIVQGTKNIVEHCKKNGTKLIFISTDYVFDGNDGPYSEDSEPNPIGVYGSHKLLAENLIKNKSIDKFKYLVVRTTVVFGNHEKKINFFNWLLGQLNKNDEVTIVDDQYSTPILAEDLADGIMFCINKEGIVNISGSESLNRYDFAVLISRVFELNVDLIRRISTKELNQKASRPLRAGLKIDLLNSYGFYPKDMKQALEYLKGENLKKEFD